MIINLTPHTIIVRMDDDPNHDIIIPPTAPAARLTVKSVPTEPIDGIPTTRQEFGEVENLPEPRDGVIYLVSTLIAARVQRADVVSPDTGPTAIRENGQIVAVRGFQRF